MNTNSGARVVGGHNASPGQKQRRVMGGAMVRIWKQSAECDATR